MSRHQLVKKDPEVDLKQKYSRWMEWAFVVTLILVTSLFFAFQRFEPENTLEKPEEKIFVIVPPPQTKQLTRPPAPPKPMIPVAAEADEEVPDDVPIEDLFFDQTFEDPGPPPEEEADPIVPFYALSEQPVVIHRVAPIYPELAKKAGIEGKVTIKVLIDTRGEVEDTEVLESHPLLDESALIAARQYKFTPAKQRDRIVKVWLSIPFHFKLR